MTQKLRGIITTALVAAFAPPAFAVTTEAPPAGCVDLGTKIDGLALTSSRAFTHDGNNNVGHAYAWVTGELTDTDASITKLRMTCTVSIDGNTTPLEPQECTVTSGTCASADAGVWEKGDGSAGPGTSSWPWKVTLDGMPDFSCTFAVISGSAASTDVITSKVRLCAR